MRKQLILFLLSILVYSSSGAEECTFLSALSPKLRVFLVDHPAALNMLTNAYSEAFSRKTVSLYYFYSDDESVARAFHFYPNTVGLPKVIIGVRENQHPLDEFITLLFEILNSKSERRVAKLVEDAKDRTISKAEFAREVVRLEFEAMKSVRDLLVNLKLVEKEKSEAKSYGSVAKCPNEFEEFLSYTRKISPKRDVIKEYELKYDVLRATP